MSPCSSHTASPSVRPPHFQRSPSPVVVLRCAEPKTIHIDLSEGKEDSVLFTIEDQSQLDQLWTSNGASGLMNGTRRSILKVEELVNGDAYTMLFHEGSKLAKLSGGVETLQGTVKTLDAAFEDDVSPTTALYSPSFLSFFLPPPSIPSFARSLVRSFTVLHPSQAFKSLKYFLKKNNPDPLSMMTISEMKLEGKTPDGMLLSNKGQKMWILEAKFNLTVRLVVCFPLFPGRMLTRLSHPSNLCSSHRASTNLPRSS